MILLELLQSVSLTNMKIIIKKLERNKLIKYVFSTTIIIINKLNIMYHTISYFRWTNMYNNTKLIQLLNPINLIVKLSLTQR